MHLTLEAVAVVAYLGLAVTIAGLFIWLHLLRTVPAPVATSVQFLQPVVGVIASAVVFGDTMGPLFVAGVILVLAGLALCATPNRLRPKSVSGPRLPDSVLIQGSAVECRPETVFEKHGRPN
ncbi:DMT family transporter [Bradyrhizobium sp.]|uniref:DMT family transporter n=1 Tax=Bradyrhizobium sp. TaxID=376 RepID=UPI00345B971D